MDVYGIRKLRGGSSAGYYAGLENGHRVVLLVVDDFGDLVIVWRGE